MPDYLTARSAAAVIGISYRALMDRISNGTVQAVRFGPRAWMVPMDEVEQLRGRGKLKPGPKRGSKRRPPMSTTEPTS